MLSKYRLNRLHRSVLGVSLMEVLASLAIISAALYGVSQTHLKSVAGLQQSNNFTVAANYVSDMAEMLLANAEEAKADAYEYESSTTVTKPKNCEENSCTTAELAKYEVWLWQENRPKVMTNAFTKIGKIDSDEKIEVTIFWDNDKSGSAERTDCPPKDKDDMDCYRLSVAL